MPRPHCCRRIACEPRATVFGPAGASAEDQAIVLALDELEALRLADLEGLYQEDAAAKMAISRATFGRLIEAGRRKVAEALVNGKTLRIEGGEERVESVCPRCARRRSKERGAESCPRCGAKDSEERGGCCGRGRGRRD